MIMRLGREWINFHLLIVEGRQKKFGRSIGLIFLFVYMEFPKLHQPALERQRIESHLKLATYQTRYFGLKCHPCSIV